MASSSAGSVVSRARANAAETPPRRGRDHDAGGPSDVPMNHSSAGPRQAEPVGGGVDRRHRRRIEPGVRIAQVRRVDGESRQQRQARRGGGAAEPLQLGPRRLGVDVVGRHRRDAAPVVDARLEQPRELVVGEVRRRLQRHLGRQDQPRHRDRPQVVVERRLRRRRHLRVRLGAEVLDDHLLQVAVPHVQLAQREQRLDPLGARLADPDQDPARVRDPQPAGALDRVEPDVGQLVGRAEVRHPALRQPRRGRLQHDPLRRRRRAQRGQLVVGEDARGWRAAAGRSPRAPRGPPRRGRTRWSSCPSSASSSRATR